MWAGSFYVGRQLDAPTNKLWFCGLVAISLRWKGQSALPDRDGSGIPIFGDAISMFISDQIVWLQFNS
jgi:hypothetical protein